ncbi:MAG: glycoside hydrolase family 16 protein [Marinifilaceae bacterium]|jgi:hypothetical protein|nr:glycoside hydrolase family 16 protein [Marinifilaceae bacterium]
MGIFGNRALKKALNTSKVEKNRQELEQRYNDYQSFLNSDRLQNFLDLEKEVNSTNFITNKKKVESLKYKKSNIFKQEKEFSKLSSNKLIKQYYTIVNKSDIENLTDTKEKKIYDKVKSSDALRREQELRSIIESDDFKKEKQFLQDNNRFNNSEEGKKYAEYSELLKDDGIKAYLKMRDKNIFESIEKSSNVYMEDFSQSKLDLDNWTPAYPMAYDFLKKSYSLEGEYQIYEPGNIQLNNKQAILNYKSNKASGLMWTKEFGFINKDFNASSAILSHGRSLKKKYGRFEAKIKISGSKSITQNFWLQSENADNRIDILKSTKDGRAGISAIIKNSDGSFNRNSQIFKEVKLEKDYFIFGLEWNKDYIAWTINYHEVKRIQNKSFHEPMYLNFSSYSNIEPKSVASAMHIDWVRIDELK